MFVSYRFVVTELLIPDMFAHAVILDTYISDRLETTARDVTSCSCAF